MEALTIVRRVAAKQDGIVTLGQARVAGLDVHEVHRLCRAGHWRLVARCVYLVDADLRAGIQRRARIRAAVESYGPNAVAVLGTAAELHRIGGPRPTGLVHVSLPGAAARPLRPSRAEVVVHRLALAPAQICRVAGIPTTTPVRTVADLVLREERYAAVSVVDSALSGQLIAVEQLPAVSALLRRRPGAVAGRQHLAEVDGRAQSPLETRTRLRCVDGKVPPDDLQLEVRDGDGYLVAGTGVSRQQLHDQRARGDDQRGGAAPGGRWEAGPRGWWP